MNYIEYITGINFRYIKPHTPLPRHFAKLLDRLARLGIPLERYITKLPGDDLHMKNILSELCKIPKMSTFAFGAIINMGVSNMPDNQVFVNVGVWHGFTLLCGMANNGNKKCVGIDNFSHKTDRGEREKFPERFNKYKSSNHTFYEMDYLKYFLEIHTEPIGLYLYDGKHTYENQLRALQIAEPFFSNDCVILVDDANDDAPRQATMDFIDSSPNRYRVILDQKTYCNRHPTLWNGIIILQRTADQEGP